MQRIIFDDIRADVVRGDGKIYSYTGLGPGNWAANNTVVEQLIKLAPVNLGDPTWKFITAQDTVELYNAQGMPISSAWRGGRSTVFTANNHLLLSAKDSYGRGFGFTYDAQNRLSSITTPEATNIVYMYDSQSRLVRVTYPDNTSRQYLYEDIARPLLLTGLLDQNGTRFASWSYDGQGRAVSSTQPLGVNNVQLSYGATSSTSLISSATLVTDAFGVQRTLQFADVAGRSIFAGQSQRCTDCYGDAANKVINPNTGIVTSTTDY